MTFPVPPPVPLSPSPHGREAPIRENFQKIANRRSAPAKVLRPEQGFV